MSAMAILRWSARLLSVALIALFCVFLVGDGIPPFSALSIRTMSLGFLLLVSLAGLLIAFRAEALGGMMGLAGAAGFYLADFIASGSFPRGGYFR